MQPSLELEARLAVNYLNSQLEVNHGSASRRYQVYKDLANLTEERRNSYAWAHYSARQKGRNPAIFHLTFDMPEISFVCDHDALLVLKLRSAALSQDGAQSLDGIPPSFQDIKITFRVTTERRTIVGNDAKVGDHESRIHLLVFDFEHAKLVETDPISQDQANDLERHLTGYLRSLQMGGHHVLFFPPEFDEDDLRSPIRFSLTSDTLTPLSDIQGFTATMINGYLSLLWYTCAYISREEKDKSSMWDGATALAGYKSWIVPDYHSEWHSSIKFGQPEVTILCAREVILYFTLSEVTFFTHEEVQSEDFDSLESPTRTPDYRGWRIALILNVMTSSTGVMIEASSARFSAQFSTFDPRPAPEHEGAFDVLIAFFVEQYFRLIAKTTLQYLFRRIRDETLRIVGSTQEADGSWWMLERDARFGANALDSTIRHTKMHGFDIVIAISQTSINNQLRSRLLRVYELARWESESRLAVEVKSISVRLLGEGRAVVTISVSEGTLWTLLNDDFELEESDVYRFGDCRVAFVVDLRECLHHELANPEYSPRPYLYPPPSERDEYDLRHIILDLAKARHAPDYTHFDDADIDGLDTRVLRTLIYLIQTEYFPTLIQQGMHIVASIPIYKHTAATRFYRLTSMKFRTFSVEVNESNMDAEQVTRSEQIIFVLGMTGKNAIPHVDAFRPSVRWVVHASAGFSHGTFAISRSTFISRLYALLSRVNALTTLVPVSPSYDMGPDVAGVVLQWAKHPDFRDQPCDWKAVDSDDTLTADRFEWKYARDWRLQEEGTKLPVKGEYMISCITHNELELPDITMLSNGSLEVRMSGQIRLRIASTRNENTWSTESSAFWKVSIAIKTAGRGIVKVEIDGIDNVKQTPPKTTIRRGNGDVPDAYAILQRHLPQEEDFNDILEELKELEGAWKYFYPSASAFTLCSPTFNFDGDLLFELRRSQINQLYDSRPADIRDRLSSSLPSHSSSRSSSPSGLGARPLPGRGPRPTSPNSGSNRPSSPDPGARRTRSPGPVRGRGGGPSRSASPVSPGRPASPRPSPTASQRSPGEFAAPVPQRGALPNLSGANQREASRGPTGNRAPMTSHRRLRKAGKARLIHEEREGGVGWD